MFLLEIAPNFTGQNSVEGELPSPNLQIDPRPNLCPDLPECEDAYEITYHKNGTTVTITRQTDGTNGSGWVSPLKFRVYDPATEVVPCFDSTIYTYLGVEGERAPGNTTQVIIDSSVKVIQEFAFEACYDMKVCVMHDDVEVIERYAFASCFAMKTIRLSRNLQRIESFAFDGCQYLDAIFVPSTVETIEDKAFGHCYDIKILSLPTTINIQQIGEEICIGNEMFFRITQISCYHPVSPYARNNEEVHQSILDFYRNLPPLHRSCLDADVTVEKIQHCIRTHGHAEALTKIYGGMTSLHILTMNPYATTGIILACLDMNMTAAFVKDDSDMSPMDYLRRYENVEAFNAIIQALCIHWVNSDQGDASDTKYKPKRQKIN